MKSKLYYAAYPGEEDSLRRYYERHLCLCQKGKVVVEYFDNEFGGKKRESEDSDFYFDSLAVHPDFRGRGIGRELIKEGLAIAREGESSAVYVDCWDNSPVSKLFGSFDFLPIIRLGPAHFDGSSSLFMGKRL